MKKDYIEFMGLRLALKTKEKIQLEEQIGNPLTYILSMVGGAMNEEEIDLTAFQLPPLKVMITTIHVASQRYEHGISKEKVMDIIDECLDIEGNSVMSLFTDVFMKLLMNGKYIPQTEEVQE